MVWCFWYRHTIFLVLSLSLYFSNKVIEPPTRWVKLNLHQLRWWMKGWQVPPTQREVPTSLMKWNPKTSRNTVCKPLLHMHLSQFSLRVCLSSSWKSERSHRPREPACFRRKKEFGGSGASPSRSQQLLQLSPFTLRRWAWPKRWMVKVPGQGV